MLHDRCGCGSDIYTVDEPLGRLLRLPSAVIGVTHQTPGSQTKLLRLLGTVTGSIKLKTSHLLFNCPSSSLQGSEKVQLDNKT